MKELVSNRMALAAFALIGFLSLTAHGQQGGVRATWFDINPSQSNDGNNGGSSGRVQRVSASSDFSRVYAATEWGGLYTSRDQGNTWVRINTFSPSVTWDVKVDPRNGRRVYATSAYDGRVRGQSQSGISISDDAGDTWRPVDIPTLDTLPCALAQAQNNPTGWEIAINPNSPNRDRSQFVFAGTNCGLGRSLDGGNTWTFVDPSPGDGFAEQVFAVIAQDAQTVDVLSSRGHFRSTNNGNNWSPIPGGPGPAAAGVPAGSGLAASPDETYVLFAQNGTNVWESDNGGQSWPTSLALPLRDGGKTNVQGRVPFIRTNKLTSNQFDVWYGDINLFKTTATSPSTLAPGGAPRAPINSWSNKQENAHWDNGDIMFDPRFQAGSCPKLFTSDGGIFLNTDPNNPGCQNPSWRQPTITPHATWIWGFDGVQSGATHALTFGLQDNGGYAATNVAEGYSPPAPNWNNYFCCDVSNNASQPGNILSVEGSHNPPAPRAFTLEIRNPDGGGRSEISNYPSAATFNRSTSGKQVAGFGQDAYAVNVGDGVYFTGNVKSPSWTALNAPSAAVSSGGNIKIATLNTRPNVFYQTADGNPENAGVLFVSSLVGTSGAPGSNWTPVNLPPGVDRVTAYDVDPNDGRRLIISGLNSATLNFEIWRTTNQGGNWTRLPQLENLMLRGVPGAGAVFVNQTVQGPLQGRSFGAYTQPSMFQFNPRDPTTIVAGAMDAGIFLSLDDGNNWQIISDPTNPTSASPPIPRPLHAYFSPGRFNANTAAFDVWVSTRGAGVRKVVIDQPPR